MKRKMGILLGASAAVIVGAAACSNSGTTADGAGGTGEGGWPGTGSSYGTGGKQNTGGSGTGSGGSSTGGSSSGGGAGGEGGAASSECSTYCELWFEKDCNSYVSQDYDDAADCLATCADFATTGTLGTYSGDNVQCRVSHVGSSPSSTHCAHAQETPTENCVDPT